MSGPGWTDALPTVEGHFRYRAADPEQHGDVRDVVVRIVDGVAVVVSWAGVPADFPRPLSQPCASFPRGEWHGPLPDWHP